MNEHPADNGEESGRNKVPFSQRERHPQTPPVPPRTAATDPDDVSTKELQQQPIRKNERWLLPYAIGELSDGDLHKVRLYLTALVGVETFKSTLSKPTPPLPYREPFFIWKMIFAQLALGGPSLVIMASIVTIFLTGLLPSDWLLGVMGATLLVLLITAYFMCRTHIDWRTTRFVVGPQVTGWERPESRLFFLSKLNPSLKTAVIQTKRNKRGKFAAFFNLNCWQVSLDSPTDDDADMHNLRFIRDGDRLVATVINWQAHSEQE